MLCAYAWYGRRPWISAWMSIASSSLLVRARDQDRCRLEGVDKPCGGKIEVHHIVGVRQGGVPFDPANSSVSVGYITKTSSMGGSS